jgi:hypothetical protein
MPQSTLRERRRPLKLGHSPDDDYRVGGRSETVGDLPHIGGQSPEKDVLAVNRELH